MNIAITGANGFIGSHLLDYLVENTDFYIKILVRDNSNLIWIEKYKNNERVDFFYGEINLKETLFEFVKNIDVLIHNAGMTKGKKEDFFKVNSQGTKNLIEVIKEINPYLKHFIYISTQEVVGINYSSLVSDERTIINPITDYGKSKKEAEIEIIISALPYTILRLGTTYGPRDKDLFNIFKLDSLGIFLDIKFYTKVSLIYVKNLVNGISKVILNEKTLNKTYFLVDNDCCSINYFVNLISYIGKRKTIFKLPIFKFFLFTVFFLSEKVNALFKKSSILNYQKYLMMTQQNLMVDNLRAKNDFYNQVYNIKDALKETWDFYEEYEWIKEL